MENVSLRSLVVQFIQPDDITSFKNVSILPIPKLLFKFVELDFYFMHTTLCFMRLQVLGELIPKLAKCNKHNVLDESLTKNEILTEKLHKIKKLIGTF